MPKRSIMDVEPARVLAVVVAVLALAASFGLGVSEQQTAAIVAAVAAVLALVQGEATRSKVTPTASVAAEQTPTGTVAGPADDAPDGTPVTVEPDVEPGAYICEHRDGEAL